MIIQDFAFYLFAGMLTFSSLMVIIARNPVHSILFLIIAFLNVSGVFILLGAEFLAVILVIVYVGAVSILFLFIVTMMDVDCISLKNGKMRYTSLGIVLGTILLFELVTLYTYWHIAPDAFSNIASNLNGAAFKGLSNTQAIGSVLYTDYVFAFQMVGLILLVAMISSVVLTLRSRPNVRRQNMLSQHDRKASDVLEIKRVTPKTGI